MNIQSNFLFILILSLALFISNVQAYSKNNDGEHKDKPSFGVIMNEDGDLAFVSPDPVIAERMLRTNVDGHARLGIDTYVFCVGSGSDVLYYPTKVSSEVGWRKTKYEKENAVWRIRTEAARKCIAAGLDAINIAGTQAKSNNMLFIPSLRMNDSHFIFDPYDYPLTGKFWLENTDLTIKNSPLSWEKKYGNLLNFLHQKVRDFRYDVFEEVISRNADVIDGFELDFNRVQVFFPKGKADEGAPLMTELVRKVRTRLNELAKEQNRPMYLFVRIPPSEESCKWAGLDIETWMKEGLVDLISPAQLMTLAHDMPIANMIKKAHQYNVQVYPSIYPRTSYRVPLIPSSPDVGMNAPMGREVTLQEALGAASNYRWMGADGFYYFNYYGFPHPQHMYEMAAVFKQNKPDGNERVFSVTKTYYNDDKEPSYAYVKQLPKDISGKHTFKIIVGEDLSNLPLPVMNCLLRVGLKDISGVIFSVKLNGVVLKNIGYKDHVAANNGKKLRPDMADVSYVFPINNLSMLKHGENTVELYFEQALVTDIEIGYACFNNLSKIMVGTPIPALNSNLSIKN